MIRINSLSFIMQSLYTSIGSGMDLLKFVDKNIKDDDDEFRFYDASTHEGHLRQSGELTWF